MGFVNQVRNFLLKDTAGYDGISRTPASSQANGRCNNGITIVIERAVIDKTANCCGTIIGIQIGWRRSNQRGGIRWIRAVGSIIRFQGSCNAFKRCLGGGIVRRDFGTQ